MEVSYTKGTCGMRMDGESNESLYVRFCVLGKGEGMNCVNTVPVNLVCADQNQSDGNRKPIFMHCTMKTVG